MAINRIYVDTSVIGGVFDEEFNIASSRLVDTIRKGKFSLVTSGLVAKEIESAPESVQELFGELLPLGEIVEVDSEVLRLVQGYLNAGIVSPKWRDDALHVALATIARCEMIISWNFRHIVHYQKIPLYNAVNVLHGYGEIAIHSPLEVVADEEE